MKAEYHPDQIYFLPLFSAVKVGLLDNMACFILFVPLMKEVCNPSITELEFSLNLL
jgi:hypothetical protein